MQKKVTATFAFASLATLIHEKILHGDTATPWDSDRLPGRRTTWNLIINNNNKLQIYIAQFPWRDDQLRITTMHEIK